MHIDRYSDFHIHSRYSDGTGSIDTLAQAALRRGLSQITITDHMPLPFATRYAMAENAMEQYRMDIEEAQEKYRGSLTINMGLEIEFITECRSWIESITEKGWKYLIASIHHLPGKDSLHLVNGTRGEFKLLLDQYKSDGRALCECYYSTLQEAYSTGWFDIAGHLDVVKKHNIRGKVFDETAPWYRNLIFETLNSIHENGMKLEINMGGFNHPRALQYPSVWIIRQAVKMGIELVLSSDSHSPESLGQYFSRIDECI